MLAWSAAAPKSPLILYLETLSGDQAVGIARSILDQFSTQNRTAFVRKFTSDRLLVAETFFRQLLPPHEHLAFCLQLLDYEELGGCEAEIKAEIAGIIERNGKEEDFWTKVSPGSKRHSVVFPYLPILEQIEVLWGLNDDSMSVFWAIASRATKILFVYRLVYAKQYSKLRIEDVNEEPDPLVQCVLILLRTVQNPSMNSISEFRKMHDLLQEYVVLQAFGSADSLDLSPLLPYCDVKEAQVEYCEGRFWSGKKEAFCPRMKKGCGSARLYPDMHRKWQQWSLLELLEGCGMEPSLQEERFTPPSEYVPRLCGWINRLNEIRSFLHCSVCGQVMTPQSGYARHLARYNRTVFNCPSCSEGSEHHDCGVYLSHCWACREMIDSRKNTIQVSDCDKKWYLCLGCGSGPQESATFSQGDICPQCGYGPMEEIPSRPRYMRCPSCNHEIRLPYELKRTGSRYADSIKRDDLSEEIPS